MARESSELRINYENCLGCGNCVVACPLSNPESPIFLGDDRKLRLESGVVKRNKEIVCWNNPEISGDCERCTSLCPTDAIRTVE